MTHGLGRNPEETGISLFVRWSLRFCYGGEEGKGMRESADGWGLAVGEPRGRRGASLPGPIGPCERAGEIEKAGGEMELGRVHAVGGGERRWAGLQPVPREEVFFLFFSGFFFKTFSKSNFESTIYS